MCAAQALAEKTIEPGKVAHLPKWAAAALAAFLLLATILGIYLWRHWPYRGREVVPTLAETFSSTVQVGSYKRFYFPQPGFEAHDVTLRLHGSTNIPPLATMDSLRAEGSYLDFIFQPGHLRALTIGGLHVRIPAAGTPEDGTKFISGPSTPSSTTVDKITADGSLLEVETKRGGRPLRFLIHALTLGDVSASRSMTYRVAFTNPLPLGELTSEGRLGPLRRNDLGATELTGRATLTGSNLGVFPAIAGRLQSEDSFHGTLSRVEVSGTTDVPDFRVGQGQPEHLATRFHAYVNGMNGSVNLEKVEATADHTKINASGQIDRKQGWRLAIGVPEGRVQDLMRMFLQDGSPVTGRASMQAEVFVPPDHANFLKSLQLSGTFGVREMHFTHPQTQQAVDGFSQRALGSAAKSKQGEANASTLTVAAADLKAGRVVVRDGIAHFADLSFSIPGAHADGVGTYSLLNHHVDTSGSLYMDADLSHATTGVKALLLKPLDPLFRKKHVGTVAPVHLGGTYDHPILGLQLFDQKSKK